MDLKKNYKDKSGNKVDWGKLNEDDFDNLVKDLKHQAREKVYASK